MAKPSTTRRAWKGAELAARSFWLAMSGLDDRLEDFVEILESYQRKLEAEGTRPWEAPRSKYNESY